MQCQGIVSNLGAYFLECRVVPEKCTSDAKWEVSVNPPRDGDDGKVRLCDLCNRFSYLTFTRVALGKKGDTP